MPYSDFTQSQVIQAMVNAPKPEAIPPLADLSRWQDNMLRWNAYNQTHIDVAWPGHHLVNAKNPTWVKDEPKTWYNPLVATNGMIMRANFVNGVYPMLTNDLKAQGWKTSGVDQNTVTTYIPTPQDLNPSGFYLAEGTPISTSGQILSSNTPLTTATQNVIVNPLNTHPLSATSTQNANVLQPQLQLQVLPSSKANLTTFFQQYKLLIYCVVGYCIYLIIKKR